MAIEGSTTGVIILLILGFDSSGCLSDEHRYRRHSDNRELQQYPCDSYYCDHGDCYIDAQQNPYCKCHVLHIGDHCEKQDPCDSYYCDHGDCYLDTQQNPYCKCHVLHIGAHCEIFDRCQVKDCGHGTCNLINDHAICKCDIGYSGRFCDDYDPTLDPCFGRSCGANGTCHVDQHHGAAICVCDTGYSGTHCQSRVTKPTTSVSTTHTMSPGMTNIPLTTPKIMPTTTQLTHKATQTTHTVSNTTPTTTKTPPMMTQTTPTTTPTAPTEITITPTTTSTTPTMTPSSVPVKLTDVPIKYNTCNKISTVMDLGSHRVSKNPNVTSCPSGSPATPEAFVINHCHVKSPSSWQQGTHVMSKCHSIPLYTPVATFFNQRYSSVGGLSGIFLGCLLDGFKLGVQQCDKVPGIAHLVRGGFLIMDPDLYCTVQ